MPAVFIIQKDNRRQLPTVLLYLFDFYFSAGILKERIVPNAYLFRNSRMVLIYRSGLRTVDRCPPET